MTPTPSDEDDHHSLGLKCVEMCHALANQRLAFKFSLKIGRFSFNMETAGMRSTPVHLPQKKAKRKSPGAKKRDEIRRREFLKRKEAAHRPSVPLTEPDIFSSLAHLGTGDPSHVDQPSAEAAQKDTVDKNPKNLNLRIEKSASGTWSVSPSLSRRNSPCQEVPECRNCHEPFLLNHQCDEDYDPDEDDDEFGDDSDDSGGFPAYLRHKEALECECSVHSTVDRSPQPKKPRNSWRHQKYPEDCKLTSLIRGEVTIDNLTRRHLRRNWY